MLPIKTLLARDDNYGGTRPTSAITFLVYHYTGNRTDTAINNATYFHNRYVDASAHYFVDDNNIYQSVPDNYVAWSVGSTGWLDQGSPYASKGHTFWGICTNYNSISIEMCSTNGVHTEATLKNAKELGQYLCNKYGITNDHVIRHFDVNGKLCPITFVTGESAWKNFKKDIGKGTSPAPTPAKTKLEEDGLFGYNSTVAAQNWMGTFADGIVSGQNSVVYPYQMNLMSATYENGGSPFVKALQRYLNNKGYNAGDVDGYMGKNTVSALQRFLNKEGFNCGSVDGHFGYNTALAFQRFLNSI